MLNALRAAPPSGRGTDTSNCGCTRSLRRALEWVMYGSPSTLANAAGGTSEVPISRLAFSASKGHQTYVTVLTDTDIQYHRNMSPGSRQEAIRRGECAKKDGSQRSVGFVRGVNEYPRERGQRVIAEHGRMDRFHQMAPVAWPPCKGHRAAAIDAVRVAQAFAATQGQWLSE